MDLEAQMRVLEASGYLIPFFPDITTFSTEGTSSNSGHVAPVSFSPFPNFNFSQDTIYARECSQFQNPTISTPNFRSFPGFSDPCTPFPPLQTIFPHQHLDHSNQNQNPKKTDSWTCISRPEKLKVPKLEQIEEDNSSLMLYNSQNVVTSQIVKPCSTSKAHQVTDLYSPDQYPPMSLHEIHLHSLLQNVPKLEQMEEDNPSLMLYNPQNVVTSQIVKPCSTSKVHQVTDLCLPDQYPPMSLHEMHLLSLPQAHDCDSKTITESSQKWLPSCYTIEDVMKTLTEPNFNLFHSVASTRSPIKVLSATDQFNPGFQPISTPKLRARQARKRIGDKFKNLEKLLPMKERMDQATMLEKAHEYVRFLKAQICALQSMPAQSSSSFSGVQISNYPSLFDHLTRHQLLQILVTSPTIQTKLCERGLCVFSREQVMVLKFISEQNLLKQQQQHQKQLQNK